jgi:post-segregation antitoxin (ccd killing protein)
MRMARVNISMPDDLYDRARRAGLNVSQLAQRAVGSELDRLAKIAALDAYLDELDAELGPVDAATQIEAGRWADRVFGEESRRSSA